MEGLGAVVPNRRGEKKNLRKEENGDEIGKKSRARNRKPGETTLFCLRVKKAFHGKKWGAYEDGVEDLEKKRRGT